MKSLFYLFLPIAGVWLFSSCANLEQVETTDLDRESVFADSAYTAGFLSQIYVDVGYDVKPNRYTTNVFGVTKEHGGLQTACDEAAYKVVSDVTNDVMFATGTINSLNVLEDDVWKKAYTNIRRVNLFMKYVDGAPLLESTKIQYKAEARFLRAWYYAMMLRHYGGVPLLGDTIYEVEDDMKTKRDTYADCVKYIVDECELAAKDLPVVFSGMNNGRATAGACKGLISRIRLYEASKLFNGSDFGTSTNCPKELIGHPNYDKERWKTAMDAARAVINLGTYNLFIRSKDLNGKAEPGFGFYVVFQAGDTRNANLTDDDGKNNNGAFAGNILDRKYQRESGHEAAYYPPSGSHSGTRHGGYIYKELADAFPMIDGKPINNSQYTFDPLNPAQNRDPRFNNTVIYDGALVPADDTYSATTVVNTWIGVGQTSDAVYQGTATGFYVRKGCDRLCKGSTWNPSRHNDPLIRYADILLMYAEAANEYHGPDFEETLGGQQLGCYPILKLIRKRAGIDPGADGMYGLEKNMTQKQMRQAIQEERRLEFAFEGHRFFDVRRWMIAPQTESKTMHGIEITRATDGTKTWKEFDVRTHVWRPAMYFFPIPYNETVKSKDLLQNPYYN